MKALDSFAASYPLEILIADDDAARRAATKAQLTQLGYMPEEAASDKEVLSKTGVRRYDVILMDVLIPGIDGILEIARPAAGQKPIFIAISPSNTKSRKTDAMPAQIDNVLSRPMDHPEFLLQLKACSVLAGKCFIKG